LSATLSVKVERRALQDPASTAIMLALFGAAALAIRLITAALARSEWEGLQFEEAGTPAVQELGLHRDGFMPLGTP
jgi:hypothetical protein